MTIQRTGCEITVGKNLEGTRGQVVLVVDFDGPYEDRSDALLMVLCGWSGLMEEMGFDPLQAVIAYQKNGKLQ